MKVDPAGLIGAGSALLLKRSFSASTVARLRHELAAVVAGAGCSEDFVLAAHELVTNAVRHGGGVGRLELRRLDDVLTCEVIDWGRASAGLPVQLSEPERPGGRGLWLAHQLTGSLTLTRRRDGVTASVTLDLTASTARRLPVVRRGVTALHDVQQIQRARAAVEDAVAVRSRAAAAVAGAVVVVSAVAVRRGHRRWLRRTSFGGEPTSISTVFVADDMGALRHRIQHVAGAAGLAGQALSGLVLAAQELMTNAVRHGGGWGRLRLRREGDLLMCRVSDCGPGFAGDPENFAKLPPASSLGGRGLYLAKQLTDDLHIRTHAAGATITLTMNLPR